MYSLNCDVIKRRHKLNFSKQAQRQAEAETVARKQIEHSIHWVLNSSRQHDCWIYHNLEFICLFLTYIKAIDIMG